MRRSRCQLALPRLWPTPHIPPSVLNLQPRDDKGQELISSEPLPRQVPLPPSGGSPAFPGGLELQALGGPAGRIRLLMSGWAPAACEVRHLHGCTEASMQLSGMEKPGSKRTQGCRIFLAVFKMKLCRDGCLGESSAAQARPSQAQRHWCGPAVTWTDPQPLPGLQACAGGLVQNRQLHKKIRATTLFLSKIAKRAEEAAAWPRRGRAWATCGPSFASRSPARLRSASRAGISGSFP